MTRRGLIGLHVRLSVNGSEVDLEVEADERLLDVLRRRLGLLGTKAACYRGECGACTVLMDGRPVLSCLVLAGRAERVETIEGLAAEASELRRAFATEGGFQCGYCTPGQVVRAVALLREGVRGDETTIRKAMSGNICRCTGYAGIARAVQIAAAKSTDHQT